MSDNCKLTKKEQVVLDELSFRYSHFQLYIVRKLRIEGYG